MRTDFWNLTIFHSQIVDFTTFFRNQFRSIRNLLDFHLDSVWALASSETFTVSYFLFEQIKQQQQQQQHLRKNFNFCKKFTLRYSFSETKMKIFSKCIFLKSTCTDVAFGVAVVAFGVAVVVLLLLLSRLSSFMTLTMFNF